MHQIRATTHKKGKRVGRGGKKGTYSGRGIKGQKSRSGARFQPIVRQVIKRYPKLRGYRVHANKKVCALFNLRDLEQIFQANDTVGPASLRAKGAFSTMKGKLPLVKILGKGKLTKALTVEKCAVSEAAKAAIEKAGGKVI
ncbi:MAG: uL15 family ribosomal protein [Patescibacteria group bacterium]